MSPEQQARYRDVLRGHPAGVTIITATVDGKPVGLTASSVSSLSLDPLAVSFSFMKNTGSAGTLLRAESVLIHFLTQEQADVALTFATSSSDASANAPSAPRSEDRFKQEHGWRQAATGEPYLPGCRAVLRCHYVATNEVGEATLIAAGVDDVIDAPTGEESGPLLYLAHQFYAMRSGEPLPVER